MIALLVVVLIAITGYSTIGKNTVTEFGAQLSKNLSANLNGNNVEAELLMPGNTVVIGKCIEILRPSEGWIKIKIDDNWYACNEWRVVLKASDSLVR